MVSAMFWKWKDRWFGEKIEWEGDGSVGWNVEVDVAIVEPESVGSEGGYRVDVQSCLEIL